MATSLGWDLVRLFFPRICVGCERGLLQGEHWLCSHCLLDLPVTNYHRWRDNPVYDRLLGRLPVTTAQAFLHFRKESIAQRLLHQLKYNNQPDLGVFLGRVYGEQLYELHEGWDVIIPVPLHATRLRRRTYNQSERFAAGLAAELDIPVLSLLQRSQATETQTRKDRAHRWENMQHVFRVTDANAVRGKKILLVDDVVTTGATLEACGQQLWGAGCVALSIACIAEA